MEQARRVRCAIYTRTSALEGLQQTFNSLHAQRLACSHYVASQVAEGWVEMDECYDDGGHSGGSVVRPALQHLLENGARGVGDAVVVYKLDRMSRSLRDFVQLMELFERHGIAFVSVTQQFSTTSSMGRLTLNVLLSFAQFEREITAERTKDKFAIQRAKGCGQAVADLSATASKTTCSWSTMPKLRSSGAFTRCTFGSGRQCRYQPPSIEPVWRTIKGVRSPTRSSVESSGIGSTVEA